MLEGGDGHKCSVVKLKKLRCTRWLPGLCWALHGTEAIPWQGHDEDEDGPGPVHFPKSLLHLLALPGAQAATGSGNTSLHWCPRRNQTPAPQVPPSKSRFSSLVVNAKALWIFFFCAGRVKKLVLTSMNLTAYILFTSIVSWSNCHSS